MIKGVAACVPNRIEENRQYPGMSIEEIEKYIQVTGIERRHCTVHDGSVCTSDLCYTAAEKLLNELQWDRSEIGLLVFISHSADYRLPSTACILQDRLGLSKECMAFDSPLGCSGFVYGLSIVSSIMSLGTIKKALLLAGNTQSIFASPLDKSTALLFGDGGSACALEFDSENQDTFKFHLRSDGSGKDALIVPDGGSRNPVTENSFIMEEFEGNIKRTRLHEKMDGMAVFSFTLSDVPDAITIFHDTFAVNPEKIDYLLLHQANKFACEKIRKKLKYPPEKVPYNIHEYGNTSAASIPLLMVTEIKEALETHNLEIVMSGFGVGLSIGTAYISTHKIVCPELLYL
ncbi:3-oxoacyl-ACP synthase III family protein [Treponema primitia]|uniref:3-oxoacyl-ACP synthase III family protein n=1 Tax=Treponema primitia TaxID=88058 RepID=UPI00030CF614|nr:ketoacyl-ACP synthase III [Treponema primitia]